jgi:hypothetical protein
MSPAAQTNEALGPLTRTVLNDMMYVRWSSHKTLKSSKRDPLNPDPHGAVRGVGNACGGRTDFHGNFQLMRLH